METSFSNQNVFDKVENWMANETDEVTTPLSSYSDVGLAAGYEVHFSPDNERLFSDGLNEEKCKLYIFFYEFCITIEYQVINTGSCEPLGLYCSV